MKDFINRMFFRAAFQCFLTTVYHLYQYYQKDICGVLFCLNRNWFLFWSINPRTTNSHTSIFYNPAVSLVDLVKVLFESFARFVQLCEEWKPLLASRATVRETVSLDTLEGRLNEESYILNGSSGQVCTSHETFWQDIARCNTI